MSSSGDSSMFGLDFFIRFAIGAIVGGLVGLAVVYVTGWDRIVLAIVAPALAVGLLSALFGDDFWSALGTMVSQLLFWW